jgi:SAM-dependent methyltransferase
MAIPDWQLPPGVDRGLRDYLDAADMVAAYDEQMRASPLAVADVGFCDKAFPTAGRLVDLGCGTGRLCIHFATKGYNCTGVDLSDEMLAKARENAAQLSLFPAERELGCESLKPSFVKANLVEFSELAEESFDYAACLFSTLGMVRGSENRAKVIANAFRLLKPGGLFVLHIHNRYFRGLGWKRVFGQVAKSLLGKAGDITMPQAYGGAPLTLHHFTKSEALRLLEGSGFMVKEVLAVGIDGKATWPWLNVYGWLMLAAHPI